jgi:hypothetical protein
MYKVNFKELRNFYFKARDSWSERFIIQQISVPFACLVLRLNQSKKLPYLLTLLNPVIVLIGGGLIYFGYYPYGGLMWFLSTIIDNMDGSISRFIYGRDPELRGTLDITFDTSNGIVIFSALFYTFFVKEMIAELFLLFLFVIFLFLYFVQCATTFRLRLKQGKRIDEPVVTKEKAGEYIDRRFKKLRFLTKIYLKIGEFAKKHKVASLPNNCDATFLIYIFPPLFSFSQKITFPIMVIGTMIMIFVIIKQAIINYIFIQKH